MSGLHKDFHGYHNFILQYVEQKYGRTFLIEGLRRIGRNVYAPLAERLAKDGLEYLAAYWKEIFDLEGGRCELSLQEQYLTLRVLKCPAICYVKDKGWPLAPSFCEHTRIINEEICHTAGYDCSVEYDQQQGHCVQKFWKAGRCPSPKEQP